jgi:hypothetical protein
VFVLPDFGGVDCTVVIYENDDFTGWQAVFGEGDYDLDAFKAAGATNDKASAAKVRGMNCQVTLYEH